MATDAVIRFKYSEGTPLCGFYKRTDAFPEILTEVLSSSLKKLELEERGRGRLNWENVVAQILSDFIVNTGRFDGIKMVSGISDNPDDKSFIFDIVIIPENDLYANSGTPLSKAINLIIKYQMSGELLYSGSIADFK